MLCDAPPPPFWRACGAPSAAAFMVEAAAEVCSFCGARPSPEKMSWFLINTGADRGDAGYAEVWLFGTGRGVLAGRFTGRENNGGEATWDEKAMAPPKPKAGEECNVLAHGRCLHKHGALLCAMYGVETRLIIHVAVLQTRLVGNNASNGRGVTGSCLAGRIKKVTHVNVHRATPGSIYICSSTDRATAVQSTVSIRCSSLDRTFCAQS